jgi:hypothetical protein
MARNMPELAETMLPPDDKTGPDGLTGLPQHTTISPALSPQQVRDVVEVTVVGHGKPVTTSVTL